MFRVIGVVGLPQRNRDAPGAPITYKSMYRSVVILFDIWCVSDAAMNEIST